MPLSFESAQILQAAQTRKSELGAEDWTETTIFFRLKNEASKLSRDNWRNSDVTLDEESG